MPPPPASWSRFEVFDLRLGLGPTGQGELAGVEHLDLLLVTPPSRAAMRLMRGLRRRFPQQPIPGETGGEPVSDEAPTASVGPTGVRAGVIPGRKSPEIGI